MRNVSRTLGTKTDGLDVHDGRAIDLQFTRDASRSWTIPTHDGKALVSQGHQNEPVSGVVFTPDFKLISGGKPGPDRHLWPAYQGPYYHNVLFGPSRSQLEFCLLHETTPFATLKDVAISGRENDDGLIRLDKRLLVMPQIRQIITLPIRNDQLVFQEFDLDQIRQKAVGK